MRPARDRLPTPEGAGAPHRRITVRPRSLRSRVLSPIPFAHLFHALSPDAQAAALVYGVVDPHVCTVSQVVPILRHAGIQAHGRPLTNARLKDANRELVDAGLAFAPRRGGGLRASPHWAPWLTMEAHRGGMLDPILAGHGRVQPGFAYYRDEARVSMELRCHTVAGRFDRLRGGALAPEAWGFLAEPGAAGLLRTLPEAYRDCALAGCLTRVIHAAASPEPIIEACLELGSNELEFAADIAFIRILQGRLDEVDGVFGTLPPAIREASARGPAAPGPGPSSPCCGATTARHAGSSSRPSPKSGRAPASATSSPPPRPSPFRSCPWCETTPRRTGRCSRRSCAPPRSSARSRSSCTTSPAPRTRARAHASRR